MLMVFFAFQERPCYCKMLKGLISQEQKTLRCGTLFILGEGKGEEYEGGKDFK